jgi:hypothetical protein
VFVLARSKDCGQPRFRWIRSALALNGNGNRLEEESDAHPHRQWAHPASHKRQSRRVGSASSPCWPSFPSGGAGHRLGFTANADGSDVRRVAAAPICDAHADRDRIRSHGDHE